MHLISPLVGVQGRARLRTALLIAVVALPVLQASPAVALPDTASPILSLDRTIRTTPFTGTTSSMRDHEGSVFVPNDPSHPNVGGTDSLWLVDDKGKTLWEVDPHAGVLKGSITQSALASTQQFGCTSGCAAGTDRIRDLESMAYDAANDRIYVFNGNCCSSTVLPTAFRLTRQANGSFSPESFQPLPAGTSYTAAAWNPGENLLYVGRSQNLRTYTYETNTSGPTFTVSGLSGILGMSFADGDLFAVNSSEKLLRVDWATKTLQPGWTLDLTSFGVLDSRGLEVITEPGTGQDQFYVSDGYDSRPTGDPLNKAVFVLDVCCGSPTPPTASFTWAQESGTRTVNFTDTSTGATGWSWDFGDGGTSTEENPSHTYDSAGTYTVTLEATNATGSSTAVDAVTVTDPPPVSAFGPAADSYIASGDPTRNFGTSAVLQGKLGSANEKRIYLTFPVTGLGGQAVSGATLRLFVTDASPSGGAWYTVSPSWIETGTGSITWNNAPAISGTSFGSIGAAAVGTWVELDVSGVVTGEGTYGFAMKSSSSDAVYFGSKESANPPQLVVTLA